jgi:hypothetical protein
MKAATDVELLAQARTVNIPIQPGHGADVATRISLILNQPPGAIDTLRNAAGPE